MKILSLTGILISILGIILSFAVIDNHINFYNTLHDALGISLEDFESDTFKNKIYKTASTLDSGTNMCFVLMGLFTFHLFVCTKVYRSKD
ncbi:hypothetical protein SAMN05421866_4370 [Chryseobacterium oranimense]|uniref:Uncharacterized protein n=1 Tax=Chryseobacterium oranimense TaxID=421058 RepID=A0A1M5X3Y0_9FLAO|nr:hypothetical protein [Chryseobacterium oranimense]SHH94555.1 hypothetical protein SAMN05421866_4370 [Chryseobacterium oranimense]